MTRKPLNKTIYWLVDQRTGHFAGSPFTSRANAVRVVKELNHGHAAILLEKKYVQRFRIERFCWVPKKVKA